MLVLGLRRGELLELGWGTSTWRSTRLRSGGRSRGSRANSCDAGPRRRPPRLRCRYRISASRRWSSGRSPRRGGVVLRESLGRLRPGADHTARGPVRSRNFHRYFKARAAKAGDPVISVHATRRTCASLLVALDVHPRVAMAILRHSQIAVTMDIYSQVSSASTREALKRLGNQLGEGPA